MVKISLDGFDSYHRRLLDEELGKYMAKHPDNQAKPHLVYVMLKEEKRSLPQNRYYWGVVLEDIADQTGYWPDEIHDFNKKNFGMKTSYYIGDEAHELIKGLSKMGRKRATEFINRSIEHWTGHGIIIREPNQLTFEEFQKAMMADEHE